MDKQRTKPGTEEFRAKLGLAASTVSSDFEIFKRALDRVWYPTVKGVAKWMGDTRLRRIGVYFLDAIEKELKAFLATEESFLQTLQRTKWDLALE